MCLCVSRQMEYNNLTEVSKGWLYGLSSLQQLHLAHNAISRIKADPWEPCQKLAELYDSFHSPFDFFFSWNLKQGKGHERREGNRNRGSFTALGSSWMVVLFTAVIWYVAHLFTESQQSWFCFEWNYLSFLVFFFFNSSQWTGKLSYFKIKWHRSHFNVDLA